MKIHYIKNDNRYNILKTIRHKRKPQSQIEGTECNTRI